MQVQDDSLARRVAASGVLLIALSLLTGIVVAQVMTGKLQGDAHIILAAHLGSLMGAFMIFGFGWTIPMLRYSSAAKSGVSWLIIVPNFGNWLITLVKAFLMVHGIEPGESTANTVVFILLTVFVVLPLMIGTFAWLIGLVKAGAQ